MKRNRTYKKIALANILKILSLFFAINFVLGSILQIKEKDFYQFFYLLICVFVCVTFYYIMDIWKSWIIWDKCDFEANKEYLLRLLKQKRFKENIKLHLGLLFTDLVLGRYEESQQEIEKLNGLERRLSNMQRLQLRLWHIDYMISVKETDSLKKELEEAQKDLEQLERIRDKRREKVRKEISQRRYLIEEKWEDVLEVLREAPRLSLNLTVYEQINTAYIRGTCYYQLGRYEEAFNELQFTVRRGGNTKYVALANALIEKIPGKDLLECKYDRKNRRGERGINIKIIFLAASCLMALLAGASCFYCSHGNSMEEAYCRRYMCMGNRPEVFCLEKIGDYETAVLDGADKMSYCLFRKTSDSDYHIVDSFRIDKPEKNHLEDKLCTNLPEDQKILYFEYLAEQEIWAVMTGFYRKNEIFYQKGIKYMGLSYFSMVENMTINGKQISAEQIVNADKIPIYIWRVENVDLKQEISVEYIGK